MRKLMRKIMLILLAAAIACVLGACAFLRPEKLGSLPTDAGLERVKNSPNYNGEAFENLTPTPTHPEGASRFGIMFNFMFGRHDRLKPASPLPAFKFDATDLPEDADAVVWFGHSSSLLQLGGKRILIDPVFSNTASPLPFSNKAFATENVYTPEEMPEIDVLLISHDHWDHLDHPTVTALRQKVKIVVCGLGVGAHFERWGFAPEQIVEADWQDELHPVDGLKIYVLPARHFSGRWLDRNKSLWVSYVLETPEKRVFYSGDSGYAPHFAEIGKRFGGFDLAIMENGQYDKAWPYIHMQPEESAQAASDLRAKAVLPVHFGRFSISNHTWDDPIIRISAAAQNQHYRLLTPIMGQTVSLHDEEQEFTRWWEGID